jgi:hypothetical protein
MDQIDFTECATCYYLYGFHGELAGLNYRHHLFSAECGPICDLRCPDVCSRARTQVAMKASGLRNCLLRSYYLPPLSNLYIIPYDISQLILEAK